jgi:hypothetical protein
MNPHESTESIPKKFDWRKHMSGVDGLAPEIVSQLDQLEEIINEDGDDVKDFLSALEKGQYRNPVLSMITYFRGVITPEEQGSLHDAIMEADPELKRRTSAGSL